MPGSGLSPAFESGFVFLGLGLFYGAVFLLLLSLPAFLILVLKTLLDFINFFLKVLDIFLDRVSPHIEL